MNTKLPEIAIDPLTDDERADRDRLEGVVRHGVQAFLEVGRALAEIQQRYLYRETHSRFEKYLIERFDIRHSQAHRLIGAHKVMEILSPIGETLPTNECQIRPLLRLIEKPTKLRETWAEIVRTAPVDDTGAKLPITGRQVEIAMGVESKRPRPYARKRIAAGELLWNALNSVEVEMDLLEERADELSHPDLDAVAKLSKVRDQLSRIIRAIREAAA